MRLDLLEERIQNKLENIAEAADIAKHFALKMRSENDICAAGLIGISAQGRKILDECERLKAICDALTHEEKEEGDDTAT